MKGWIKLHRSLIEWGWYRDTNTRAVFIHLLLVANHKDRIWQGKLVARGQRITSIQHIANELGLTERKIRTAIKHLVSTGEVTSQGSNRYTLLTVVKYEDYQCRGDQSDEQDDEPEGKQKSNKRRASDDKQECKKDKNEKNTLSPSALEIDFEEAWTAYGKKGSRKTSFGYWKKLSPAHRAEIKLRIPLYVEDQEDPKFQKDFNGWINPAHKRWQNALKSELKQSPATPTIQKSRKLPEPKYWKEAMAMKIEACPVPLMKFMAKWDTARWESEDYTMQRDIVALCEEHDFSTETTRRTL